MTDVQSQQNEQSNPMEGAPMWAIQLMQQVDAIKAQQERDFEAISNIRNSSQQKSNEPGVIHLAFGDVADTPENRAMNDAYGSDTNHLAPYDPIAEIRATKEGQERWARIREAHAAYMAERDQNRILTEEEQAAKEASRERAAKAMGFAGDKGFWK